MVGRIEVIKSKILWEGHKVNLSNFNYNYNQAYEDCVRRLGFKTNLPNMNHSLSMKLQLWVNLLSVLDQSVSPQVKTTKYRCLLVSARESYH